MTIDYIYVIIYDMAYGYTSCTVFANQGKMRQDHG